MADPDLAHIQAESSWLMVPYLDEPELIDLPVVWLLRHPQAYIESLCKIWRTPQHTRWTAYAAAHAGLDEFFDDRPTWAAAKWLRWNGMIRDKVAGRPTIMFRVERDPWMLLRLLVQARLVGPVVDLSRVFDDRTYNTKIKRKIYHAELSDIQPVILKPLLEMARTFGYTWQ
jgi:hypothetical protein